MPRRALRCLVDINVHVVSCPGVWLPRRDDLYLSVSLFSQFRRTQLTSPSFPLLFHEKFRFDKVFYTAYEPSQVAESLEDMSVLVELIQISDLYDGGRLLASYQCNARSFLYPYPSWSPTYGPQEREILLERSLDFPGISPKLEFSSKTVIKETAAPLLDPYDTYETDVVYTARSPRPGARSRSRSRSRSRRRCPSGGLGYSRPTIASIYRCRSPSLSRRLEALDLVATVPVLEDERPPFVVRKVDSNNLIGRKPGTVGPRRGKKGHRSRRLSSPGREPSGYSSFYDEYLSDNTYRRGRISTVEEPYRPYKYYSTSDSDDSEVMGLTGVGSTYHRHHSPPPYRSKSPSYLATSPLDRYATHGYGTMGPSAYRAMSPYRYSLRDRFDERPYSPTRSELISTRVGSALRRNRSLDRLDRLGYSVPAKSRDVPEPSRTRDESTTRIRGGELWNQRVAAYQGKHHRDHFNSNLEKIYSKMYQQARTMYL